MKKFQTRLILITLFFLPVYLIKIKFSWVSFNILELLIAALCMAWIFNKNTKYLAKGEACQERQILDIPLRGITRRVTKYKIPAFLIFIGLILSVIANGNYYAGFGAIKGWFVFPIIFAIILFDALKKDDSLLKKSLLALFFSGVAISAIGILYKFLGILTYDGRLKIFWDSPNQLAMFLSIPFLIGLLFAWREEEAKKKRVYVSSLVLIGLCLLYTFSYGAWLALTVALFVLFWLEYSKKEQKKYLAISILIFAIIISLASLYKYKRLQNIGERSSLASRFAIWKSAGLMTRNNSLFGIGPGNFQEKYLEYQKYFPPYLEWSVPQPHNILLAFWLESGVVGLIGFIILLVYFFRDNKKAIKIDRDLGILFLGTMTYVLIHGLVDTTYWRNDLALVFWVVVAMNCFLAEKNS
jgi:O-antigen ligase